MVALLAKWFIADREDVKQPRVRQAYGMLCGAVGIGFNLLLFVIKFFAGIILSLLNRATYTYNFTFIQV